GRTIARETAEDLLLGDHTAVRARVADMQHNEQIHYLAVAGRNGQIIASGQPGEIGTQMSALLEDRGRQHDGGIISRHDAVPQTAGDEEMLLFDVPIRYQEHRIGTLRLGIDSTPLKTANRTTLGAMLAALLATLIIVLGTAWWLFRRLLTPIDVLRHALLQVAHGDFAQRIRLIRRDEFGRLFTTFNLMTESLSEHERTRKEPTTDERKADPTRVIEPPTADVARKGHD
ncbi:MAG TPA: HAMP domain-containing protein, partial [Guyparkeria sp.]|nr:HAMP domain-containing protein [Guyparkeria sp.]